ncbi:phage baseplate assembly protein V [Prevotella intermedia]|uniref:phage baseplate assembly protein V n=1 Tax=Prevotella intermedia TaxID=28131 RepID=UPI00352B82A6
MGEGSYYRNRFKAIPSTVEALPSPRVPMPVAETQMATVTSNADPNGNGRVQVRMNWQQGDMHTGWVRVMTPDAGKSGDVSSNRGFVFIPEVGDQVLLGFRHGDPARPYVMGSLFNGSTGGGGGQGNKCKSLTTRSGSSLKLDDSDGSVTLHDKGGVSMNFDGAGNACMDAQAKIGLSVGDANSELILDKDGNVILAADSIIAFMVGNSSIVIDNNGININSSNINLNGTTINIKGTTNKIEGKTNTISGTNSITGGPTTIDKGKIKLN